MYQSRADETMQDYQNLRILYMFEDAVLHYAAKMNVFNTFT